MPIDPSLTSVLSITISTAPASDSWGFVGVVCVGEYEAFRTVRAYATPGDALLATQQTLGGVLGTLMAGQEWRQTQEELGHAPRRVELEFGLRAHSARQRNEVAVEPHAGD